MKGVDTKSFSIKAKLCRLAGGKSRSFNVERELFCINPKGRTLFLLISVLGFLGLALAKPLKIRPELNKNTIRCPQQDS